MVSLGARLDTSWPLSWNRELGSRQQFRAVASSEIPVTVQPAGSQVPKYITRETRMWGLRSLGNLRRGRGKTLGEVILSVPKHRAQALLFMWPLCLPQGPEDIAQRRLSDLLCSLACIWKNLPKKGIPLVLTKSSEFLINSLVKCYRPDTGIERLFLGWKTVLSID